MAIFEATQYPLEKRLALGEIMADSLRISLLLESFKICIPFKIQVIHWLPPHFVVESEGFILLARRDQDNADFVIKSNSTT
jgi:hypothetical protein